MRGPRRVLRGVRPRWTRSDSIIEREDADRNCRNCNGKWNPPGIWVRKRFVNTGITEKHNNCSFRKSILFDEEPVPLANVGVNSVPHQL